MWRYVKAAFWAHGELPLVGPLPCNALAVLGMGILGCALHPLWLIGVGLETAYLFVLTTNPRFQRVVNALGREQALKSVEQSRGAQLAELTPEGRARRERLEAKIRQALAAYGSNKDDDLLRDSNADALEKLGAMHLRLLLADRHLRDADQRTDEAVLTRQRDALERELADGEKLSASLRESKQATLELTRKRLTNCRRRSESLAEVESDLARIEAQVDLALEEASLEGKPSISGSSLNLLNRILESNSALGSTNSIPGSSAYLEAE